MRNFNDVDGADVAVLPRSSTLLHTTGTTNPRDEVSAGSEFTQNLAYLEQRKFNNFLMFDKYRVEPNGLDNNFPQNFKDLLDNVYIGHGVNRALINLLLSGGVGLYKEIKEDKKIIRDWQLDSTITNWLESFDFFEGYIPSAATDLIYVENSWTAFQRNKGFRVGGKPFIAGLESLSVQNMRLEYPDERGIRKKAFFGEWLYSNLHTNDIKAYPLFDKRSPFRNKVSVHFSKMPTFGSTSYGRPTDISAVSMLKVLALLPNFHKANLTERGFKWVVSISSKYYEEIRDRHNWAIDSKEFLEWKENFKAAIDEFLVAPEGDKIQTRFMTEFAIAPHDFKTVDMVKITKLEDDTKDISETGMDLHDTYSIGYLTSKSIHPQLANVNLKNQSLSGSNLREAYEMHIKTATPMMRNILLGPANAALKINFPNSGLKLGFMDLAFEEYNKNHSTKQGEI